MASARLRSADEPRRRTASGSAGSPLQKPSDDVSIISFTGPMPCHRASAVFVDVKITSPRPPPLTSLYMSRRQTDGL